MAARVYADPVAVTPDPPPRRHAPVAGPAGFAPVWNLDGFYVWLGPTGAASRVDATWDSTFGADLAFVRVREREPLSAIGATLGASLWTEREGGRVWADLLAGRRIAGRIYGLSAGPILELADLAHPRLGGSVGVWAFVGITPFARVGIVDELGPFAEVGVHIALPVLRR